MFRSETSIPDHQMSDPWSDGELGVTAMGTECSAQSSLFRLLTVLAYLLLAHCATSNGGHPTELVRCAMAKHTGSSWTPADSSPSFCKVTGTQHSAECCPSAGEGAFDSCSAADLLFREAFQDKLAKSSMQITQLSLEQPMLCSTAGHLSTTYQSSLRTCHICFLTRLNLHVSCIIETCKLCHSKSQQSQGGRYDTRSCLLLVTRSASPLYHAAMTIVCAERVALSGLHSAQCEFRSAYAQPCEVSATCQKCFGC